MDRIGSVVYENRIFIHNLSYDCTEQDIKDFFKDNKGVDVNSVSMLMNPRINKPSGAAYGWVGRTWAAGFFVADFIRVCNCTSVFQKSNQK